MLITSRERKWAEVAAPVEVDVLARAESVALLRGRVAGLGAPDADRLAAQLGDLPLAVAQAAGFMAETGMPAAEYLDLLRTQAGKLLDQAAPGSSYPRSLAAATRLAAGPARPGGPGRRPAGQRVRVPGPRAGPRETCSPAPRANCPASWRPGRRIRWPGGRPWPGWPGSRWPGSTSAGW